MRKNNFLTGFTLIELLIAASIFSIVALALYSVFHTGILSYHKIDSAFDVYQSARLIFNRIELDLKNSFVYKEGDSQFNGQNQTLEFFSVLDAYKDGGFTTDIFRIKYDLADKILMRYSYSGLEAVKINAQPQTDELAYSVETISFEYAHPTGKPGQPYEWQEVWPKDETRKNILPLAVKIKLSLAENDKQSGRVIEFSKVVPLKEKI